MGGGAGRSWVRHRNHSGFKSTSAYVGQRQTAAQTLGSDPLEVVDGTKAINHLEDVVVKAGGAILRYGVNRTAILWIAELGHLGSSAPPHGAAPTVGGTARPSSPTPHGCAGTCAWSMAQTE